MQKIREEGLSLPGEAEDKCCWCIPLKIGVILIGVGIIGSAVNMVIGGVSMLGANFLLGILLCASAAPILLSSWMYIKWFRNMEDADAKNGLFKACLFCIFSWICYAVVGLILCLTTTGFTIGMWIGPYLITSLIVGLIYLYYAGACKKYAKSTTS